MKQYRFDRLPKPKGKPFADSARVRSGIKSILLGPAGLYEALRQRGGAGFGASGG